VPSNTSLPQRSATSERSVPKMKVAVLLLALVALSLSQSYQLIYFDGHGRGEQIRLFFADQSVTYTDTRLDWDTFVKLKPTFPWGLLPVLNISGIGYLSDTEALNVWLGRRWKQWPSDQMTEQRLIAYASASEDLRLQKNSILGTGNSAPPADQTKFLPVVRDWLSYFERNLQVYNSKPYLSGTQFTPVDCRVWDILDQIFEIMKLYPNLYDNYPLTQAFRSNVSKRPNIAEYLKHRK